MKKGGDGAQYLVQGSVSRVSGRFGRLIAAVENDDILSFRNLQPALAELRIKFSYSDCQEWNLLHLACYRKLLEVVKEIVAIDSDILSTFDKDGKSPLHIAIRVNSLPVVEFLAEQGADIDYSSDEDQSIHGLPMFIAMFRDVKIMEFIFLKSPIIMKGSHTTDASSEGYNLFAYELLSILISLFSEKAEETGIPPERIQLELILRLKLLHRMKTDFNFVDPSTRATVLNMAIELDYRDVLEYLLSIGVDPNVKDYQGGFACDYAIAAEKYHLVGMLQRAGGRFNTDEMR